MPTADPIMKYSIVPIHETMALLIKTLLKDTPLAITGYIVFCENSCDANVVEKHNIGKAKE